MTKKKRKKQKKVSSQTTVDIAVVGAGPAGLQAARRLHDQAPMAEILVIESEDRMGGRSCGSLHLLDANQVQDFASELGDPSQCFTPAKVRWDRQWVAPENVKWDDKLWIGRLPQWGVYLSGDKFAFDGAYHNTPVKAADDASDDEANEVATATGYEVKYNSPVRKISRDESEGASAQDRLWRLETPDEIIFARRVVWAAGMQAFQNAYGKFEAQEYLTGNSSYDKAAADFRGGVACEFVFTQEPRFEEGFDPKSVMGLPVKHNGSLYLMIGALLKREKEYVLQTLTHVHGDVLVDPKEVASLQKSLRRALRNILASGEDEAAAPKFHERWVVNSRVGGHMLGNLWVFGNGERGSFEFVGDETKVAVDANALDILGALTSVKNLAPAHDSHFESNDDEADRDEPFDGEDEADSSEGTEMAGESQESVAPESHPEATL